jgi:hypothetical protein
VLRSALEGLVATLAVRAALAGSKRLSGPRSHRGFLAAPLYRTRDKMAASGGPADAPRGTTDIDIGAIELLPERP